MESQTEGGNAQGQQERVAYAPGAIELKADAPEKAGSPSRTVEACDYSNIRKCGAYPV
ncbi:MAG: hypothetical protein QXQ53_04720 [Candidatus Methanosuratincola sp.]